MSMTTITGIVSGVRHSTETIGQIGKHGGQIRTGQVLTLRVDGRPAQIKLKDAPDVRDGEPVTLAGFARSNGSFHALALRNDQTRAVYSIAPLPGYLLGGLLVLVGLPLLLVLVGVLFLGFGGYTLWQAYRYDQAARMLR